MTQFMRTRFIASFAVALAFAASIAHAQFVTPEKNLTIDGIPPIPVELAEKVRDFGGFTTASMVTWHPKGGILIRTRGLSTAQLFRVAKPGAKPEAVTRFVDAVAGASFPPRKAEYLLFMRASGGDEVYRIFRMDIGGGDETPVSPAGLRAGSPVWNRAGDRVAFTATTVDGISLHDTDEETPAEAGEHRATQRIMLVDPLTPSQARTIATIEGGRFDVLAFAPDDQSLLLREAVSANESHLWLMTIVDGNKRRITRAPAAGPAALYAGARFAKDGASLLAISDRDSEFRRLVRIDIASGKETPLAPQWTWDVSEFSVSEAARRIALITNEEGSSVLRFLDLDTAEELPRPAIVPGVISGLHWGTEEVGGEKQHVLAFNLAAARAPGAVFAWNIDSRKLIRWTAPGLRGIRPADLAEPELIRWKSFDGLTLSGFLYRPDRERYPGKRPVVINIHGGPEGQARPGFLGRTNYLIAELGVAYLEPNVRGSSGFGKTFLALDNGQKREDAVKDIGALLDWIRAQPDLDADRVLVRGGSYGGYMSLAVSVHYADRIRGAIDIVGISNFITFFSRTESYRRDLRRAEYGDERDPNMRRFLQKISPLSQAEKIVKPLMVVQGKNDPRVPYTEALQIVAQMKKQRTPVWFLMADDEGHGFVRKANQDFLFLAELMFIEQTLLK